MDMSDRSAQSLKPTAVAESRLAQEALNFNTYHAVMDSLSAETGGGDHTVASNPG